jgi:carotenoid cleavage dioxygenase
VANAFENEEGKIEISLAFSKLNVFFWWTDKNGKGPAPEQISSDLLLWKIDPKATDLRLPPGELVAQGELEFPRIDDRWAMSRHSTTFFSIFQPQLVDFPFVGPRMGGGYPPYNGFAKYDAKTGEVQRYFAGPRKFTQELVFIPRSKKAEEADGWILFLQNDFEAMVSELAIVDSTDLSKAVAIIKLPVRLRPGLHGNWVDDGDVDGHPGA